MALGLKYEPDVVLSVSALNHVVCNGEEEHAII